MYCSVLHETQQVYRLDAGNKICKETENGLSAKKALIRIYSDKNNGKTACERSASVHV
jgi:hypothetical protein